MMSTVSPSVSRTLVEPPTLPFPQYTTNPLSIYIHIPFCQKRCTYCDFATFTGQAAEMPAYVDAVITEMSRRMEHTNRPPAQTLFFGGGTPSLLPPPLLAKLIDRVRDITDLADDAEITMEANPGTLTVEALRDVKHAGVNRLSFGVQTLNDIILAQLGRIHSAAEALEAWSLARDAGYVNISGDLIYGLPGQDMADWQDTVTRLMTVKPVHISLYALTAEERTPLFRSVQKGLVTLPTSDTAADMFEWARSYLRTCGYEHYEISNWAVPGWESRHNMAYWAQTPYLGFGVSAHEYFRGQRRGNVRGLAGYMRRIQAGGDAAAFTESISSERAVSDGMIFGLRVLDGVDRAVFTDTHGRDPVDVWPDELSRLVELELLEVTDTRIRLTERAELVGNYVWEHFL